MTLGLNDVRIETERLIVRKFEERDFEQFCKLLDMPEFEGWQMQKPRARQFLEWHLSNYERMDIVSGTVCFGIFDKITLEIVGQIAAQKHDDLHEPEFGYSILPFARGRGYAKEAARATLEWIEQRYDIPYIIGTVEISNLPSQKVLEHCGFQFVDERSLLVHDMDERVDFKYYRYPFTRVGGPLLPG
ncbi:GNAT family N-acetyltransferase [Paenibacillus sp. PR3]|uniref:GNAT family N-acetyltransferase n=1 Tax=Paenibacillus terricola TaxID=2763503 RepID=A0ABR8MZ83_9BACL|nr:GNAT family N-acetyltransferase [Paenibacillus terricola]MBD3919844.1 GNAT family N-acetyltransferase [Paenibacillus terricola]